MRAVIYARYSSDHQRAASITDQVAAGRDFIERQGWRYLTAYTDAAVSGASIFRPAYQKLLEDARAGAFDVVVAESLDRLSRDQADVATLYKQLSYLCVQLVTLGEGEVNELHVGLKGTMNALYLKDLADKTRRGLRGRVQQGKSGGGLCYGYAVVPGAPGERRIDPAAAAIIRRVFRAFAGGQSPREIARNLNAEGVPGPHGREWRDTAIRGHRTRGTGLLNNELYMGRLVWNRLRYVKDPATGKRVSRPNPPDQWVVESVPELRIVDDALWEQAKRRQDGIAAQPGVRKARATEFWKHRRTRHLLTGLVTCGTCGGPFKSIGRDYLGCSSARGRGTCTNTRSIRRHRLETLVLEALKHRLMAPELVGEFTAAFHAEINARRDDAAAERRARARDLERVSRKLDGLIDAIAEGYRTAQLQTRLEELEQRKAELERGLANVDDDAVLRLHPNLAELYRQRVEALHVVLADPQDGQAALELLRALIERIVLTPQPDAWEVTLEGAIAAMVAAALQADHKTAALGARAACSLKVVAGVGFEPTTFRL